MRDSDAGRLRRYVNGRARNRIHNEYVRYDSYLGAWLLCDEGTARAHAHWRRIRHPGQPWCPVLGRNVAVASDTALQSFFEAIGPEEWRRLELAVRLDPSRCLREWRAQGDRLIAAVRAAAEGHSERGQLSGWLSKRGTGARSLLPQA